MKYELMLILDPKLSEKDLEKSTKEIKDHITEHGFSIVDEDVWGHRPLAYKMKNHTEGYYIILIFEGECEGTLPLKADLRLMNFIIRTLFIKVDDDYTLIRYDNTAEPAAADAAPKQKLSKHAEELSKKVASSKKKAPKEPEPEPEPEVVEEPKEPEEPEEKTTDLDEKLQAIIDDTDIDL